VLIQLIRSISTSMLIGILAAVAIGLIGSKFMAKKIGDKPYFTYSQWFDVGFFSGHWLDCCQLHVFGAAALVALVCVLETWMSAHRNGCKAVGARSVPLSCLVFRVFIILLSIFCSSVFLWFLSKSAWGLRIRAVHPEQADEQLLGNSN